MRSNQNLPIALLFLTSLLFINCQSAQSDKPEDLLLIESGAGKAWNVFGVKIIGKVMSEATDGEYAVIITHTPPEGGPPLHVHENEDELFYVLQGTYRFTCGEKQVDAPEGSMIRLPKGIPHGFLNIGDQEGITMNTITPGGFEQFFDDIAKLSVNGPPDRSKVDSVALRYGMTFIK